MIRLSVRAIGLLTVMAAAIAGCGDETRSSGYGSAPTPADPAGRNLVDPDYSGRFEVAATVLESPEHGPQLCEAVAESYPPQCGGPDIIGWDWQDVEGEQSAGGTTWGSWILIGTWDGERFTLTEPPRPDDGSHADRGLNPDFTSPCREPEGGWRPVDPDLTTDDALRAAFARAANSDDYAGGWIDQAYLDDPSASADPEGIANDPMRLVLNLRFTGDLDRHEREIREVWGGALCISGAHRTEAELRRIQDELPATYPDMLSSGVDVVQNALVASTWLATTAMQAELDERYGEGTVVLHGLFKPVD